MKDDTIYEFCDELQHKLVDLGFTVHRKNAYSTCSVYLALDYGVAGNIRISDHLKPVGNEFNYNVNSKQLDYYAQHTEERSTYVYGINCMKLLVAHLAANRAIIKWKIGAEGYKEQVSAARITKPGLSNFWKYAYDVNKEVNACH